jgi:hypothetical protein
MLARGDQLRPNDRVNLSQTPESASGPKNYGAGVTFDGALWGFARSSNWPVRQLATA